MNINIIALINAILLLASGLSVEEQSYKNYILNYPGNNTCIEVPPNLENITPINITSDINTNNIFIISDTHIFSPDTEKRFKEVIAFTNKRNYSYIIIMGDVLDDGQKPAQYEMYNSIKLTSLNKIIELRGNHDKNYFNKYNLSLFNISNNCLILLDSYNGVSNGIILDSQVQMMINWTQNLDCSYFNVFSHHKLDSKETIRPVLNVDKLSVLKKDLRFFNGHNHQFNITNSIFQHITVAKAGDYPYTQYFGIELNPITNEIKKCNLNKGCDEVK